MMAKKTQRRRGFNGATVGLNHDPLGGNKRAHCIATKRRGGMSVRKIAKHYGISVSEVALVLKQAGLT